MPDLLTAVWWGLVLQIPWIAGLIIAGLLHRQWKTSGVRLTVLALGLLTVWGVAGPLVVLEAVGARWDPGVGVAGVTLIMSFAVSFLGNVISIILVIFLALALFWLMKDLAGSQDR